MLKLLKYLTKGDWGLAVLALGFIVAQVWLDLTMPDYMSEITTLVQTEGSAMSDILIAGAKCWPALWGACRFHCGRRLRCQDCRQLCRHPAGKAV